MIPLLGANVYTADLLMASTYKAVIDYFAKPVLRDAMVHFNQEVVRVENVSHGGLRGVQIKTLVGFERTFDHVVVSALPHRSRTTLDLR